MKRLAPTNPPFTPPSDTPLQFSRIQEFIGPAREANSKHHMLAYPETFRNVDDGTP